MNRAFRALLKANRHSSLVALMIGGGLAAAVTQVGAIGLGQSATVSFLGQPLNLVVPVRDDGDDPLTRECVSAKVQAGDVQIPAPLVHVALETGRDGVTRIVRVTTEPRIVEPVVTIDVSVGCPVRLMRRFVVFVDPPVIPRLAQIESTRNDQTLRASAETSPKQPASSAGTSDVIGAAAAITSSPVTRATTEPIKAVTQEAEPATPRAVKYKRAVQPPSDIASLSEASEQDRKAAKQKKAAKKSKRQTTADVPNPSEGRLQLEAVKISPVKPKSEAASSALIGDATAIPASAASAVESPMPAASAPSLAASQPPPESIPVAKPSAEPRRSGSGMPTLRTLWHAAREGSIWPLIVGLISLLMIGGVVHIWRLPSLQARRRAMETDTPSRLPASGRVSAPRTASDSAESKSVKPVEAGKSVAPSSPVQKDGLLKDEPHRALASGLHVQEHTQAFVSTGTWADFTSAQFAEDSQSSDSGLDSKLTVPATFQESSSQTSGSSLSDTTASTHEAFPDIAPLGRDVSVEKLIDLEQQAEFCVALGQDEEAIELLATHVQVTGGSSALPFLKLLEIFKRLGDQDSYATWRGRFSQRFGVVPPGWEGDLSQGAGLEAYTSVMDRIQVLWHDFGATMALLQRLLVPPEDDQTGLYMVASSLSLPAYQDLLLLYSVARDLSEHEVQGNAVDVFLPLEAQGSSQASTSMMATLPTPVAAHPGGMVDLHLDIDLSDNKP